MNAAKQHPDKGHSKMSNKSSSRQKLVLLDGKVPRSLRRSFLLGLSSTNANFLQCPSSSAGSLTDAMNKRGDPRYAPFLVFNDFFFFDHCLFIPSYWKSLNNFLEKTAPKTHSFLMASMGFAQEEHGKKPAKASRRKQFIAKPLSFFQVRFKTTGERMKFSRKIKLIDNNCLSKMKFYLRSRLMSSFVIVSSMNCLIASIR